MEGETVQNGIGAMSDLTALRDKFRTGVHTIDEIVCGSRWQQVILLACMAAAGSTCGAVAALCGWGCWCMLCTENSAVFDAMFWGDPMELFVVVVTVLTVIGAHFVARRLIQGTLAEPWFLIAGAVVLALMAWQWGDWSQNSRGPALLLLGCATIPLFRGRRNPLSTTPRGSGA